MTLWEGAGYASRTCQDEDASRALSHRSPAGLIPSQFIFMLQPFHTIFPSILGIFLIQYSKVCCHSCFPRNNSELELLQLQAAWELHPLLGRPPWK